MTKKGERETGLTFIKYGFCHKTGWEMGKRMLKRSKIEGKSCFSFDFPSKNRGFVEGDFGG